MFSSFYTGRPSNPWPGILMAGAYPLSASLSINQQLTDVYHSLAFAAFGGILFGYDTGTISGVKVMGDWLCTFGHRKSDAWGDCYITTSEESLVVCVLLLLFFLPPPIMTLIIKLLPFPYWVLIRCSFVAPSPSFYTSTRITPPWECDPRHSSPYIISHDLFPSNLNFR